MAWVRCRRGGIPARLVLDTDGITKEITLWFRASAAGGESATANVAAHANAPQSGKRRRERARRARRRDEKKREAEGRCWPPATPTSGVAAMAAAAPSPPPSEALPPADTAFNEPILQGVPAVRDHARTLRARPLPMKRVKAAFTATRASQRAAVIAKRRGQAASRRSTSPPGVTEEESSKEDEAPPENLRETDGVDALETTLGFSPQPPPPPPPSSPSPPSSPQPATSRPPTPPPMSSRFPETWHRVLCRQCFLRDHDIIYYHCSECHNFGRPTEAEKIEKIANLKRYV